jgi:formate hydrogenlyase subunit 6/NADH:ubiquinone oxidoreductase subunit I
MAGLASASWWQNLLYPLFTEALTLRPVVKGADCIACQDCVNICPEGVISTVEDSTGRPQAWINDEGCIRCYCCHETCPEDAIELKKSLLYRVVMG